MLFRSANRLFEKEIMSNMLIDNKNADSYFVCREDDKYITELLVQTPVQLRSVLQNMWESTSDVNDLINALIVLAFKLKEQNMTNESIKERIYNF